MQTRFTPPHRLLLYLCLTVGGTLSLHPASADQPDTRHGAVEDNRTAFSFEGGFTLTWQHATAGQIDDEAGGSLDLVTTLPMLGGFWTLYVEGGTTPAAQGVTTWLPEANAEIGSALKGNGRGRIQVSEFHYAHPLLGGQITAGLLDPTGFLDHSEVANDETRQFLGASFVNNTVIEFPDYHLALAWHRDATPRQPGITLLLGSSHGLGDNQGHYGALMKPLEPGKGVFAAMEGYGYLEGALWRLGVWTHTADHARLDDPGQDERNWGVYGVVDGNQGELHWNLRLGWADPRISQASNFIALTVEKEVAGTTFGAGLSRTGVSPEAEGASLLQAELYARFETPWGVELSPDLQWLRNSNLDPASGDHWVAAVRASYQF